MNIFAGQKKKIIHMNYIQFVVLDDFCLTAAVPTKLLIWS